MQKSRRIDNFNPFLVFNVLLFIVTSLLVSIEGAMYSTLTYLVTSRVIDFIIKGFENYVGLIGISKNSRTLEHSILRDIGTRIIVYNFSRGYGSTGLQHDGEIMHLIINRIDIRKAYNLIHHLNQSAFVVEFDVNNISSGGLRKYLSKQEKKLAPSITVLSAS